MFVPKHAKTEEGQNHPEQNGQGTFNKQDYYSGYHIITFKAKAFRKLL